MTSASRFTKQIPCIIVPRKEERRESESGRGFVTILNQPYQDNGSYESEHHLKAKIKVAKALSNAGYDVEYETKFWPTENHPPDKPFRVDVYIPMHRVYVEIDGKTHDSKWNKRKDAWKDECLQAIGLHPIRISLMEAAGAPEQVIPMVRAAQFSNFSRVDKM